MTTAEIRPNAFVPVELLRWTDSGKVQVLHRRVFGPQCVLGQIFAVPAMKLIHPGGRKALARQLAELPR